MNGSVAKRYARALASVAADETRLEQTAEELERVTSLFVDPELAQALASPTLRTSARQALIGQATESLALSPLAKNFLRLLADKNRITELPEIFRAYQRLVDRALGRVRGVLTVATPVSDAQVAEIATSLEQILSKTVQLSVRIDPGIIAGTAVEIEGRVYDGSVRTQLGHLARTLAREEPVR